MAKKSKQKKSCKDCGSDLIDLTCSEELTSKANAFIREGIKKLLVDCYSSVGKEMPLPMFLHILNCQTMEMIYRAAPHPSEANRLILSGLAEVREQFIKDTE